MPPGSEVLGFVHVSTYKIWDDLGRWYWGLVKDQFDLDDETRELAQKITEGQDDRARQGEGGLRLGDREHALRGARVRHLRLQAAALRADGGARLGRLQGQGDGDRHAARRSSASRRRSWWCARGCGAASARKSRASRRSITPSPTCRRSTSTSTAPPSTPASTSCRAWTSARSSCTSNEGKTKITTIPVPPRRTRTSSSATVRARVQKGGEAKLSLDYRTAGYNAAEWRRQYHAESARRERMNHDLGGELPGFVIAPGAQGLQTSNLDDAEEPVHMHVEGTAPSFARREGASCSMAVTNSFRLTSAYASLSQRKQDVSILAFAELRDTFVVELPAGVEVVSAPESANARHALRLVLACRSKSSRDEVTVKGRARAQGDARRARATTRRSERFCEEADRALGASAWWSSHDGSRRLRRRVARSRSRLPRARVAPAVRRAEASARARADRRASARTRAHRTTARSIAHWLLGRARVAGRQRQGLGRGARAELDELAARGLLAELRARPSTTSMHGRLKTRLRRVPRGGRAARDSNDPRAPLFAWLAAHEATGFRHAAPGLWKRWQAEGRGPAQARPAASAGARASSSPSGGRSRANAAGHSRCRNGSPPSCTAA